MIDITGYGGFHIFNFGPEGLEINKVNCPYGFVIAFRRESNDTSSINNVVDPTNVLFGMNTIIDNDNIIQKNDYIGSSLTNDNSKLSQFPICSFVGYRDLT